MGEGLVGLIELINDQSLGGVAGAGGANAGLQINGRLRRVDGDGFCGEGTAREGGLWIAGVKG